MIDRLSRDPEQCLNLKNEWSMSMKPALETKRKAKDSEQTGKEHNSSSESNNQKRGRQEETEVRDTGQVGKERPGKKRKHLEASETQPKTTGAGPSTGASTPVAVKVRRMEMMGKVDQGPGGTKIQPTLRSFMDLKCGLVGTRKTAGSQKPVNHARAGRDPSTESHGDTSLLIGEATRREKESEEGGSSKTEEPDRSKERKPETQGQGVTMSSTRPRQGKVVASRKEALECMIVRGEEENRRKSKGREK